MSGAIDTNLELQVSFEGAGEGSLVSDACMQEIAKRLRVALRSPSAGDGAVKIASDSENILSQNAAGELRVQRDTFYVETKDVAVPAAIVGGSDNYLVPITRRRITALILESGDVVQVPNGGQTQPGNDYPATLTEFAENLTAELGSYTFEVVNGVLRMTSVTGLVVDAVIEGGESESDAQRKVDVIPVEGSIPGDVTIAFEEAASVANIDYASQFMLSLDVSPGDGFEKAYIISKSANRVRVKIEKVSKPLAATLRCFTPAQKEDSSEF